MHIRSHGTKLDRNIRNNGRGHRPTPTQAKSPARANTASGATIVNGLIRLQASHENTHIERTQRPYRSDFITLQATFASFSPTWGNPRQARGSPKLLGLIRKAHRELKGMISSHSQFFRQVRSGWDWVFLLKLPRSLYSSLPSSLLRCEFTCESAFTCSSVFISIRVADGELCKSRDYLILVSASHIHNSKGRAFSCTVALEPSNPPFSNVSLRKIFLWTKTNELIRFCVKYAFSTVLRRSIFVLNSSRRGRRYRVKPGPRLSDKVTS